MSMSTGGSPLAVAAPGVSVTPWGQCTVTVTMSVASVSAGQGWVGPDVPPVSRVTMASPTLGVESAPPAPSLVTCVTLTQGDVCVLA